MHLSLRTVGAWVAGRAQERSTWVGLAMFAASLAGHQLDDSTLNSVATVGQLLGSVLMAASTSSKS